MFAPFLDKSRVFSLLKIPTFPAPVRVVVYAFYYENDL